MRRRRKPKTRRSKRQINEKYSSEESSILSSDEVAEKTLGRLHSLGNQTFAVFPFSEYFHDWLVNLKGVLTEFELNSNVTVDHQFDEECSRILSNVELELDERRNNEASYDLALRSLSEDKRLLKRIDEDHAAKLGQMERRKSSEIKRLSRTVQDLKEEFDHVTQTKTGIFRAMSKKAKAQKQAEAARKLSLAQGEYELIAPNFSAQQQILAKEHTKVQQPVVERIQKLQKEINSLEIDGSLGARRAACEAVANAINGLLRRKNAPSSVN